MSVTSDHNVVAIADADERDRPWPPTLGPDCLQHHNW
jgi:hypothetical protein